MAIDPNAADSGRMTPETLERRRKVVDAMLGNSMKQRPIQHWAQGLAQLAEAGVAGYQSHKLDEQERANSRESAGVISDAYNTAFPGSKANVNPDMSATPSQPSALPLSAPGRPSPTTGKIYSNDEPSPLDPPSGGDRDAAVRTIIAEAGNQGPVGMQAVGNVIRNRAVDGGFGGDTASGVVTAPSQFEPWNTAAGRAKMASIDPNSPQYQQASKALDMAYTGDDPTNGAKNFIAPKVMEALGRPMPAWSRQPGQMIGDHKFIGGVPQEPSQAPYQVAGPAVASPGGNAPAPPAREAIAAAMSANPATGGVPAPSGPQANIAQAMAGQQPAGPDLTKLIQAVSNPYISDEARKSVMGVLNAQLAANKVQTVDLGNAVGIMDARGNLIRSIPKGEPNKGPEFGDIGVDPNTGDQMKGWRDPRNQSVTPYTPPAPANAGPSQIPPPPAGVDPKVWRKNQSERLTNEAMPADDKSVSALRNEIQGLPSYKNFAQAAPVYRSMNEAASRDNRAADLNLIYGFGKIMDPGSVVRESEMTMAQKINTLPEYLRATVESQLTGSGRLSPEVRAQIMQEAHGRLSAYKGLFDQDAIQYRGIAKDRRMKESHVIPDLGSFEPWTPPKASTPAAPVITEDGYKIRAR